MSNILCLYWRNPTFYLYVLEKIKVYFVSRSYKDYFYKKKFLNNLCYSNVIWHLITKKLLKLALDILLN